MILLNSISSMIILIDKHVGTSYLTLSGIDLINFLLIPYTFRLIVSQDINPTAAFIGSNNELYIGALSNLPQTPPATNL